MTRRRRKLQISEALWLDWTDQVAQVFGVVPAAWGWTPPLKVKVVEGATHVTWSARFKTPEGVNTARVTFRRTRHDGLVREMDILERGAGPRGLLLAAEGDAS